MTLRPYAADYPISSDLHRADLEWLPSPLALTFGRVPVWLHYLHLSKDISIPIRVLKLQLMNQKIINYINSVRASA